MKHTPRPWEAEFDRGSTPPWSIPDVADVFGWKKGQAKANAYLIASAPELLEACKKMIGTHGMHGPCNQNSCSSCDSAYNKAKQAIAKAEGDSK